MMESCREKIVSDKYADFLWKSSWSPNGLESFFPEVCYQMINDYYDVYYVLILSILVDTFISKISLPMQPVPEIGSISVA